jgi:hypothetical protein
MANKNHLEDAFLEAVKGLTITDAFYDDDNTPCLQLSNGGLITVLSDDEGNRPGVPVYINPKKPDAEVGMYEIR